MAFSQVLSRKPSHTHTIKRVSQPTITHAANLPSINKSSKYSQQYLLAATVNKSGSKHSQKSNKVVGDRYGGPQQQFHQGSETSPHNILEGRSHAYQTMTELPP